MTIGALLYAQGTPETQNRSGILVRVGLMLFIIWIAYPQLETLKNRLSMFVIGIILFLLVIVAARPQIFPIAAIAALGTVMLNGFLRRMSGNKPK